MKQVLMIAMIEALILLSLYHKKLNIIIKKLKILIEAFSNKIYNIKIKSLIL